MRIARVTSRGGCASFGLALALFGLAPAKIGPQDLAALLTGQPGAAERWRSHLIDSPFGTIHPATFRFPRIGSPPSAVGIKLASLGPDVTGALGSRLLFDTADDEPVQFPVVDRTRKGDRLVAAAVVPRGEPKPAAQPADPASDPSSMTPRDDGKADSPRRVTVASVSPAADAVPAGTNLIAPIAISPPRTVASDERVAAAAAPVAVAVAVPGVGTEAAVTTPEPETPSALGPVDVEDWFPTLDDDTSPVTRASRVYFGAEPIGGMMSTLQPWGPGQQPVFENVLPDPGPRGKIVSVPRPPEAASATGGETVAGKGQVTGEGRRPKSPAERLGLTDKTRAKAEKCLTDAIYFEARGEPVRGQIAVAQVVMNRVFSGYYPGNVCGVVYQNANRRLACQFTFACDGIRDRVTEPGAWSRAKRIARDTLDGKYWLDDVGKATHYHASWVHPWWVRGMRKLDRIGVHTFYRPRRWGDGSDAPNWGDATATREAARHL